MKNVIHHYARSTITGIIISCQEAGARSIAPVPEKDRLREKPSTPRVNPFRM